MYKTKHVGGEDFAVPQYEYNIDSPRDLEKVLEYEKSRKAAGGHFEFLEALGCWNKKRNAINLNKIDIVRDICELERAYSHLVAKRVTLAKAEGREWLSKETLAMIQEMRQKYKEVKQCLVLTNKKARV